MAINIELTADAGQVISETANLAEGYDKVKDRLKEVARAGDEAGDDLARSLDAGGKSADKLERRLDDAENAAEKLGREGKDAGKDLERGMRDGEDAAKKLERETDDAFDSLAQNARKASKQVGDDTRDGFNRAGQATAEFKDEARANLSETVSSFRGDVEDIPQIMQDVLGGVSANLGAIGGALTVGLAAAIGITIGKLQELSEKNTAVREGIADLARDIYDAGGTLDDAAIDEKLADIAFSLAQDDVWWKWGDQAKTYIGMVQSALQDLGDTDAARDAFKGLAGDLEAAARAQDALARANEEATAAQQKHIQVTTDGVTYLDAEGRAIQEGIDARNELSKKIEEQTGVTQGANAEVEYFTEIMGQSATVTETAADAIRDRASALSESANAQVAVTETENRYIETVGSATQAIAENGRTLDVNSEAGRANRSALADLATSANAMRDAQIEAGVATEIVTSDAQAARDAFVAAAEAAGMNTGEAEALASAYGMLPGEVNTLVMANGTAEAKAAIEGVAAPTTAPVEVTTGGSEATAQGAVDSVQGTTAPVEVTTEGTDGAVQERIDGIKGKEVKVDVDDMLTVRAVQDRINGIKGKEVGVRVYISNLADIETQINNLTAPRSMWVTVNKRAGVDAP